MPSFGEWGFILAGRRPFGGCRRALPRGPALPDARRACRRCSTFRPTWRACRPSRTGCRTRCWCTPSRRSGARCTSERAPAAAARWLAGAAALRRWAALLGCARPRRGRGRRGRLGRRRRTNAATALRDAQAPAACPRRRCSAAPACWSSAPASPAWPRRARLVRAGVDDVQLLRAGRRAPAATAAATRWPAWRCPLGAHYLPLPGPSARRGDRAAARARAARAPDAAAPVYDERHLCHSPQERLFIDGAWHDGLLPPVEALPAAERERTLAQYRRFAAAVDALQRELALRACRPRARRWSAGLAALDAQTFAAWLAARGLRRRRRCAGTSTTAAATTTAPAPRQVSAWAGLHYFASRHGFRAPGDEHEDEREAVLTWPEGNAWLARAPGRAAAASGCTPAASRCACRRSRARGGARRVERARPAQLERWTRSRRWCCACRSSSPRGCSTRRRRPCAQAAAAAAPRALAGRPTCSCDEPLLDRARRAARVGQRALRQPGARLRRRDAPEPARRVPGPTVLTRLLGARRRQSLRSCRRSARGCSAQPWTAWARRACSPTWRRAHPDLARKTARRST